MEKNNLTSSKTGTNKKESKNSRSGRKKNVIRLSKLKFEEKILLF